MDIVEIRVLGALGILVVGLLTTVGAFVLALLAAAVTEAGLVVAAYVARIRGRAAGVPSLARVEDRATVPAGTPRVDRDLHLNAAEHVLLARQAWWRLRC